MLQFDHLALRRGPQPLFEDAHFNIHPGQKVGVTGANGCGKSSLFALILNELHADAGDFRLPAGWVIAHVAQHTPSDPRPAIEYALDGDAELRRLEQAIAAAEQADDGVRLARLHADYEHIGGYQARARAGRLLHGLGFAGDAIERPVEQFSGGWRMRLNLARALMCRSDLLLLDEPTNHLDLDAVIWLEGWLRSYPGTLLLISHDRDFLDRVCDHILHIEQHRARLYRGNYSAFEHVRAEQLANQRAAYERQQREVAHMQSFVERFRAKATKARQAQSRLKALARMQQIAPAHVDSPFHFQFREPEKVPRPLLQLDQIDFGYNEQPILSQVHLTLNPGDRIGLLGPNGAGKSTLIKLLAGQLTANSGQRDDAQDLRIGYFAQHQVEQLHPEHSPLEHLQQIAAQAGEQSLRDYLGGFGFAGERCDSPVAPFSGGEKARLVLALLAWQRPNLLLLDEPTNHLDLEMRQALAVALQDFAGAMVIVSHDRHLLRVCCDQLLLVHERRLEEFVDSLDDYPAWLARQQQTASAPAESTQSGHSAQARKQRKREQAEQRKRLQPLRKQLAQLERELDHLHQQQTALDEQLADPALYQSGQSARLRELGQQKAALDEQLEQVELDWLETGEQLQALEAELAASA